MLQGTPVEPSRYATELGYEVTLMKDGIGDIYELAAFVVRDGKIVMQSLAKSLPKEGGRTDKARHRRMLMLAIMSSINALSVLALTAGILLLTAAGNAQTSHDTKPDAIRTFRVHIPEKEIADLRRRIAATRWPDKETVTDRSQ